MTGGVEPRGLRGAVSLDLSRLSGLVEVDATSRAVRLRAGTFGPAAEEALKPHGLTLRFYPQSFERSTVGGWLATRAAGHFSTRLTHIDDLTESIRAVTPAGTWESRRLPGSGAGPVARPAAARQRGLARASSPRPGCGPSPARRTAGRRPSQRPTSAPAARPSAPWSTPASLPPPAG